MQSLADLLLIAVVSEAYKGELVSHKCLWYWEGLLFTPILLDVIKVTGVDVTAQFRHDWGGRCTLHQKKEEIERRRKEKTSTVITWNTEIYTHMTRRYWIFETMQGRDKYSGFSAQFSSVKRAFSQQNRGGHHQSADFSLVKYEI